MDEEEIKKIKEDLYQYKTLYNILFEENKKLKEDCFKMQNTINELQQKEGKEQTKRGIIYRALRKIYHVIKR